MMSKLPYVPPEVDAPEPGGLVRGAARRTHRDSLIDVVLRPREIAEGVVREAGIQSGVDVCLF